MRTKLIQKILETMKPDYPEQMTNILKRYEDTNLIAYAWDIGINVDELFQGVVS